MSELREGIVKAIHRAVKYEPDMTKGGPHLEIHGGDGAIEIIHLVADWLFQEAEILNDSHNPNEWEESRALADASRSLRSQAGGEK